jgi:hypothetical protein
MRDSKSPITGRTFGMTILYSSIGPAKAGAIDAVLSRLVAHDALGGAQSSGRLRAIPASVS